PYTTLLRSNATGHNSKGPPPANPARYYATPLSHAKLAMRSMPTPTPNPNFLKPTRWPIVVLPPKDEFARNLDHARWPQQLDTTGSLTQNFLVRHSFLTAVA